MGTPRLRSLWRVTGIALLVVIFVVALAPMPGPEAAPVHLDKLLHGLTFLFLTLWFAGFAEPRGYLPLAVALLAYGAAIEAAQGLLSYRQADPLDLLADALGIVAGWIAGLAGLGGWCRRLELRLAASGGD